MKLDKYYVICQANKCPQCEGKGKLTSFDDSFGGIPNP